MPHLTVYVAEDVLDEREPALIEALTEAVVGVYGEWARDAVTILVLGVPGSRWGLGGSAAAQPGPIISFGIREAAFARPDAEDLVQRLAHDVTSAVGRVLGSDVAARTQLELVATPSGRTAVGGRLVDD